MKTEDEIFNQYQIKSNDEEVPVADLNNYSGPGPIISTSVSFFGPTATSSGVWSSYAGANATMGYSPTQHALIEDGWSRAYIPRWGKYFEDIKKLEAKYNINSHNFRLLYSSDLLREKNISSFDAEKWISLSSLYDE